MREIKFRAWFPAPHYSEPHMAYSPTDNTDDFGGRSSTWDLIELLDSGKSGHPIYMQYTGLKDKNGKEIYEGDICRIHVFCQELGDNMGVVEGEREFIAEIHFGPIGVHVKASYGDDNLMFYDNFHEESFEVIGNIYENPGLINSDSPA